MLTRAAILLGVLALAACAQKPPTGSAGLSGGGTYKVGKPYQIKGVWYYPAEDWSYNETGIASWYGPGFHTRATANGETYNEMELTAAHKTLPMPSLVRVTNLDNGRSVVVRVNDRGPFVHGRIIDMSRRGAQLLGFETRGTAKVRVQILADESRQIAMAARRNTPAAVLAESDGPAPRAAPRSSVQVAQAPPPSQPAPRTETPVESPRTVAGATVDGRFLPAPVVVDLPVPRREAIYVQAGAFTVADNASRLTARLGGIAPAAVSQATVNGQRFYRVRLGPISDVDRADAILERVIAAGHTDAKIIVD
ncbi:septal ring lytic transglycosylase RlpA family protein [Azospirillum halopraeferens]|uniref:septal ring lytic transglycosylase RlpA family protein n=1 Tax=Azospirillum halopraeferens TaxID=34010 RepID=UPI000401EA4F|nr:septal ring lytic transglycosylase RlpA family protein [Azospirillum halopraeferens]